MGRNEKDDVDLRRFIYLLIFYILAHLMYKSGATSYRSLLQLVYFIWVSTTSVIEEVGCHERTYIFFLFCFPCHNVMCSWAGAGRVFLK